ncbi:hypothetical protein D3C78_743630 [compost metagenome]
MPFDWSLPLWPTRLADGFGHARFALFMSSPDIIHYVTKIRNSPLLIGSPVFNIEIRPFIFHLFSFHFRQMDYKPYFVPSQSDCRMKFVEISLKERKQRVRESQI